MQLKERKYICVSITQLFYLALKSPNFMLEYFNKVPILVFERIALKQLKQVSIIPPSTHDISNALPNLIPK